MLSRFIIENIFIIIAESFWIFSNFTQLRHVLTTKDTRGLSAITITLYAAGNVAWMTYFFLQDLWVPVATNATMLILTLIMLFYVLGRGVQFAKGIIAILVISPITGYLLFSNPSISGWIGVVYNLIAASPQIYKVVRYKKVTGLSERALYFATGAMLSTFTYALLIGSVPLMTGCAQGLVFQTILFTYYYRYRTRTTV